MSFHNVGKRLFSFDVRVFHFWRCQYFNSTTLIFDMLSKRKHRSFSEENYDNWNASNLFKWFAVAQNSIANIQKIWLMVNLSTIYSGPWIQYVLAFQRVVSGSWIDIDNDTFSPLCNIVYRETRLRVYVFSCRS